MREPWFSGCILCGVYFDGDRDSWNPYLRAVYNENNSSSKPKLSGVTRFWQGVVSPFPLDEDHVVSYSMLNLMDSSQARAIWPYRYHARVQRPPPQTVPGMRFAWGVVFHDVCFKYLCEISGGRQNVSIEALNTLCLSCPVQRFTMNFGHDYGGVMKYRTEPQKLFPGDEPEFATSFPTTDKSNTHESEALPALKYAAFDPEKLPEVQLGIDQAYEPSMVHGACRNHAALNDCFSALPVELIQTILIYLPSTAVVNLKIASPVVNEVELPEVFWASRFQQGHEFYCISKLPVVSQSKCSWRMLHSSFCNIKSDPHFKNRRRIWDILLHMHGLLNIIEKHFERHGGICRPDTVQRSVYRNETRSQLVPQYRMVAAAVRDYPDIFTTGCRPQWSALTVIPKAIVSVRISLVSFGGMRYIAGLHIVGDDCSIANLGYKHENIRTCVEFSEARPKSIKGIISAVDSRGLRGLQFLFADGVSSTWTGEHRGLPKRRLVIHQNYEHEFYLLCEFDGLKMISLGAIPQNPKTRIPRRKMIRSLRSIDIREKHHWIPDIPSPELHLNAEAFLYWQFPNPTNSRHFQPLTIMHFGGNEGIHLSKLINIVAYRGANDYICSIEFHYCEEVEGQKVHILGYEMECATEEELGYRLSRWKPTRTEFFIDGPGGEFVTGIEWQRRPKSRLEGFAIETSRGRTGAFLKDPPKPWDMVTKSMHVDPETTITGIYGAVQRRVGIISLGVISEKL